MSRIRRDDADAFDQLVRSHWQATLGYARSLTCDPDAAMDMTQEAFVRLWQARHGWQPTGSVRSWLLRTARNVGISEQRRRSVRERWVAAQDAEPSTSSTTPLHSAQNEELRAAMSEAIDRLSPRRREVFVLFHLQNLSYREIAEIMSIREQSVANYLQAALGHLRCALRSFYPALAHPDSASAENAPDE